MRSETEKERRREMHPGRRMPRAVNREPATAHFERESHAKTA